MADNFRIKFRFDGKEYSSGVCDVYRDKTMYQVFLPVELRATNVMGPQFILIYRIEGEYTAQLTTALSTTLFNAFVDYIDKQPL